VNKVLVPKDTTAPYITNAFQMYATGKYSLKTLKKKLDDKGFKTANGKVLTKSNYHQILNNPIYCGMIRWSNKLYAGSFPPLIDEQLFYQTQAMLKALKMAKKYAIWQAYVHLSAYFTLWRVWLSNHRREKNKNQ